MKGYVLEGIGQLTYKDVPVPVVKDKEVLVEVKAAGICGSDIPRIYETGTYHFPTIPGHEFSGRVVETGKRVGVFPLIPCRTCPSCRKKQYEMCSNYNYLGSRCDGGFAEYAAVPEWNLIELPEQVSYEEAALLEPASVALHSVRRLDWEEPIETVTLLGLGTIGVLIAEWLNISGVKKVYASGHSEGHGRLMQSVTTDEYMYCNAKKTDIPAWIAEQTSQQGTDVVMDCVATAESLADAIACVRPGGQIVIVGNPKGDILLEKNIYWKILRKQIRVTGTWNSSFTHEDKDDWNTVLQKAAAGELNLQKLISHRFSFEDLHEGLKVMRDKSEFRNKVMIVKE